MIGFHSLANIANSSIFFFNISTISKHNFHLATINGKFAVECILLGIECFDSKNKNQRTVFISTDAVISFRMPRDTRARARALHYSDFSNIFNHSTVRSISCHLCHVFKSRDFIDEQRFYGYLSDRLLAQSPTI